MAFCRSCGKEMFEQAVSCPNCGNPNERNSNESNKGLSIKLKIGIFLIPAIFAWFTLRKGVSITARIVSFAWMILIVSVGIGGVGEAVNPAKAASYSSSSAAQTQQVKKEVQKVSATTIFSEYERNEISADNKYKGEYVEISGRIDDIGKDLLDDMYVVLAGSDFFFGVQVYFNDEDSGVVANLSKGKKLTVVCEVEGLMINVLCRDAVVVD